MNAVLDTISTYPTVIYTVLLGVALVYWLLSLFGGGHHGHHHGGGHGLHGGGHHGLSHHGGAGAHSTASHGHNGHQVEHHHPTPGHQHQHQHQELKEISRLASFVTAMGLNGVPFSVVFSLLVLFAWLCTGLVAEYVLPWVPTVFLKVLVATATLPLALVPAVPATALIVRPLRGMFVTHQARSNYSLIGETCTILTLQVTDDFGQAEVAAYGASIQIPVNAPAPNQFTKGSRALVLEYDEATRRYLIGPAGPD